MSGGIAKIVQEVSADGDACTVDFIFFRALVYGVAWAGNFFVGGDLAFLDPVKYNNSIKVTVSLEKPRKFVYAGGVPAGANFLDGVADKVFPGSKFAERVIPNFSTGKCINNIIVVGGSGASR